MTKRVLVDSKIPKFEAPEVKIPDAHVELAKEQDPPATVEDVAPDPEAPAEAREDDKPEDLEEQSTLAEPTNIAEESKKEEEP